MTKNDLLEADKLLAYCAGKLDDPVAVEHIRSSEACRKWISEHRLIRLLAKSGVAEDKQADISPEKLTQFADEELPQDEMLTIENTLAKNSILFEDYLATRMERIAENEPAPSKEVDERVLNLLLSNAAPQQQTSSSDRGFLSEIILKIQNSLSGFFGPSYWVQAGAIAAVLLIAVVGGKQMGLYGEPEFQRLIIASLESKDPILKFRGGASRAKIATMSEGVLTSINWRLHRKVADALTDFEKTPSKQSLEVVATTLVRTLNEGIARSRLADDSIESEVLAALSKGATFDLEKIDGIQIQPELWKRIKSGSIERTLLDVTVVKTKLNLLYFALAK